MDLSKHYIKYEQKVYKKEGGEGGMARDGKKILS